MIIVTSYFYYRPFLDANIGLVVLGQGTHLGFTFSPRFISQLWSKSGRKAREYSRV